MPISPTQPYPFQQRYGPITFLDNFVLAEGQLYVSGIPLPDGTTLTIPFVGGHDTENKIIGQGFQSTSQPLNQITAPPNVALLTWNGQTPTLNFSTGNGWAQMSGGGGTLPTTGTVDGGTFS